MEKVALLFFQATGCRLEVDASWTSWKAMAPESYTWLRPYIRPCHQRVLNDTVAGLYPSPLSLIRQLLRPYEYRIEAGAGHWTVRSTSPEKGVRIKQKPTTIVWSDDESIAE